MAEETEERRRVLLSQMGWSEIKGHQLGVWQRHCVIINHPPHEMTEVEMKFTLKSFIIWFGLCRRQMSNSESGSRTGDSRGKWILLSFDCGGSDWTVFYMKKDSLTLGTGGCAATTGRPTKNAAEDDNKWRESFPGNQKCVSFKGIKGRGERWQPKSKLNWICHFAWAYSFSESSVSGGWVVLLRVVKGISPLGDILLLVCGIWFHLWPWLW